MVRSWDKFATIDWAEQPGLAVTNRMISSFSRSKRAFFWEPFPNLRGDINANVYVYTYQTNGGFPYSIVTGCVVFQLAVASFLAFPSAMIGAILLSLPCIP